MRRSAFTSKSRVASIHGRERPRSLAGFDRNRNGAALVSHRRSGQRRQIPRGQGQVCVNRAANTRRRRKIRDPVPGSLHGVHASRRLRAVTGRGRQGERQFYISMRSQCATMGDHLFIPPRYGPRIRYRHPRRLLGGDGYYGSLFQAPCWRDNATRLRRLRPPAPQSRRAQEARLAGSRRAPLSIRRQSA